MEDFIFKHKSDAIDEIKTICYTVAGNEDILDENDNPLIENESASLEKIFAKKTIRNGGQPRYSVRIDLNNKFFNPMSIYDDKIEKNSAFLDSVCRANNKFVDVNLKVFNMYLNFLKTKNMSWFYNAEREMT